MTFEQGLISALSIVTSALVYVCRLLWQRSQACEEWRSQKEPLINDMCEKLGAMNSALNIFRSCKTPECMFSGIAAGETFSLKPNESKRS